MMTVETFFGIFLTELRENKSLWEYYKFLHDPQKLAFRKAYFCQRLQYIADNIGGRDQEIWDCGSGYGTTGLFLAMNGYRVRGNTLEFYYQQIEERKKFWSRHGDSSLFECSYQDLYDTSFKEAFDTIILQDTLHHLEPLDEGLQVLHRSLIKNGKLLVIEENGSNITQRIKLFRQRGFNKKVEVFDEQLNKKVVFADEQIRGFKEWRSLLHNNGFSVPSDKVQYIRFFPPFVLKKENYEEVLQREQRLAKKNPLLKKYLYFGINFIARKN